MAKQYVQKIRLQGEDATAHAYNSAKRNAQNYYRETLKAEKASRAATRQSRAQFGQLGHQIQDVAVQLQMGMNPLMIFGQQGSQIASIFGPKGAIIGGVIAIGSAILGGLLPSLFKADNATQELDKAMEGLNKVIKENKDGAFELTKQIMELAKQSAKLAELKLASALIESKEAMELTSKALKETIRDVSGLDKAQINRLPNAFKKLEEQNLSLQEIMSRTGYIVNAQFDRPIREAVNVLTKTFNVSQEEAYKMVKALSAFKAEATPESANRLAETITDVALNSETANDKLIELAGAAIDSKVKFDELGSKSKDLQKFQQELAEHGFVLVGNAANESSESIKKSSEAMDAYMALRNKYLMQDQTLYRLQVDLAKAREAMDLDLEKAILRRIALHKKEVAAKAQSQLDRDEAARMRALTAAANEAMGSQKERIKLLLDGRSATKKFADESARLQMIIGMGRSMDQWSSAEIDAYKTAMEKLNEQLFKAEEITPKVTKVTNEAKDSYKSFNQTLEELGDRALQSVEDGLVGLISGTQSAKDAFSSMARSIVNDMIRMQVRSAYMPAISNLFSAGIGQISAANTYGTNIGSEQTRMLAAQDAGFRAYGGPVSGGSPYIVGEKGPELFVPSSPGRVVPNNKMGGGDNINITLNVSTGVSQTVKTEIAAMIPTIQEMTKAAVVEAKMRGGSFSTAFGA